MSKLAFLVMVSLLSVNLSFAQTKKGTIVLALGGCANAVSYQGTSNSPILYGGALCLDASYFVSENLILSLNTTIERWGRQYDIESIDSFPYDPAFSGQSDNLNRQVFLWTGMLSGKYTVAKSTGILMGITLWYKEDEEYNLFLDRNLVFSTNPVNTSYFDHFQIGLYSHIKKVRIEALYRTGFDRQRVQTFSLRVSYCFEF
jgi:hypothetical protein